MELVLLGGIEVVADTRTENEWRTADCPTMVRLSVNKQKEFARFVLEATSHEEAMGSLMNLEALNSIPLTLRRNVAACR